MDKNSLAIIKEKVGDLLSTDVPTIVQLKEAYNLCLVVGYSNEYVKAILNAGINDPNVRISITNSLTDFINQI